MVGTPLQGLAPLARLPRAPLVPRFSLGWYRTGFQPSEVPFAHSSSAVPVRRAQDLRPRSTGSGSSAPFDGLRVFGGFKWKFRRQKAGVSGFLQDCWLLIEWLLRPCRALLYCVINPGLARGANIGLPLWGTICFCRESVWGKEMGPGWAGWDQWPDGSR
jgi:hypothetical protein